MTRDDFWTFFMETGDIAFYLMYKTSDKPAPERAAEPADGGSGQDRPVG